MLDVRRMRLLRELARLGTIAAVAQAYSYTPSAVSQQLRALEREAGVPLVRHAGRRVELTPAGAELAIRTERVLELLEEAAAALAAGRAELAGELRIGAFPTATRCSSRTPCGPAPSISRSCTSTTTCRPSRIRRWRPGRC